MMMLQCLQVLPGQHAVCSTALPPASMHAMNHKRQRVLVLLCVFPLLRGIQLGIY